MRTKHFFFYVTLLLPGLPLFGLAQEKRLAPGVWRGEFQVDSQVVPFNFEIAERQGKTVFTALNADRRDDFDVQYVAGTDSVYIIPETFEYRFFGKIDAAGELSGVYRNMTPGNTSRIYPFRAKAGESHRFVAPDEQRKPEQVLTGKWALKIAERQGDAANRVALFEQKGSRLNGIILSITGDSRELQGDVQGNTFRLSGFTGSGVTLVEGILSDQNKLSGSIGFGNNALRFEGERNDSAALADAYSLTHLKPGYEKLEIRFPDLEGNLVTLDDAKYKGKVVIIELLGSWCPNCIDQIQFLAPWFRENQHRGVEVLGVAFEAKDDPEFARKALTKLKMRYDIRYDIVFGGKADAEVVQSKFEALNTFLAFPTTIIIGRDGKVREIHTGFSGKGTGVFYEEFVGKWNKELDLLLAERP